MVLCSLALAQGSGFGFAVEAGVGQRVTVNAFPSGTVSGYPFTVTARPDGSLPVARALHSGATSIELWVKFADGRYGQVCDYQPGFKSNQTKAGLLLPAGEYLYESPVQDEALLLSGAYLSPADQGRYWSLATGATPVASLPITGGGSFTGQTFTVSARPDGSLPVVNQRTQRGSGGTIYRLTDGGTYSIYYNFPASKPSVLLLPGEYAMPAAAPLSGSPADYRVLCTGEWILP